MRSHESLWWRDLKLVCRLERDNWFDDINEWNIGDDTHDIDIFKYLWKIKIPKKVSFMLWCVFYD